ncbi:SMP-30/gluconolactonase/LRE family protein [Gilvimarinus xylanilyticus]|uniref:SMP-30/gluconolactonase/LRE family protein n=1 Tax=Gilvimarinus xylanilyticus TaxID=2944139 RepID=A0A9X2HZ14_9GAMM|nr:SMP-30/gluconolactonase/LRE family protein [Gilvimarinus xylanilyticus]MCP8901023.1 SMP-30/gluconolactonase/LRE family protein [Gilvimarinus xylanilyticus]
MKKSLLIILASCLSAATGLKVTAQTVSEDWLAENTFTQGIEGPVVGPDGTLYAVNFAREGTIGAVNNKNAAQLWLELPQGSTGNALRFAPDGTMLVADYTGHNILRIDPAQKTVSTLAHNPEMHQPNDIAVADNGFVYASDPNWTDNTGQLWLIKPDGATRLLESDMGTTNGIELSPDGHTLYVNESVQRIVWAYRVNADGSLDHKREFFRFTDYGLDGMSTDTQGNLYIARYGAGEIAVLTPQGELAQTIQLTGQHPTNITFGGPDGKRAFVTMQKRGTIESFSNALPGADWSKLQETAKQRR